MIMGHAGNMLMLQHTALFICYKMWWKTKSFLYIFCHGSPKIGTLESFLLEV